MVQCTNEFKQESAKLSEIKKVIFNCEKVYIGILL